MRDLFQRRFLVNTGKGGVGKTTLSVAMALALARQGKRVLLMQLNVRDRLGAMFDLPPIGPDIVPLAPNVFACNTTPRDAMREYALMVLPFRALYGAVFENRLVEKFLRVIPGLPELVMLGKAYFHEKERHPGGVPVWDVVIVDAPATGHGVFLLQIPQVITRALHSGRMADEARMMLALLEDPQRTMVNLVTLPEDMPVNETLELATRLEEQFGIQPGCILANAVYPRLLQGDEPARLGQVRDAHRRHDDELAVLLDAAAYREERCDLQREHLDRLRSQTTTPVLEVPFLFTSPLDRQALDRLATHITTQVDQLRRGQ